MSEKDDPVVDAQGKLPNGWSISVELTNKVATVTLWHLNTVSNEKEDMYHLDAEVQDLDNCIIECADRAQDIQIDMNKCIQ